MKLDQLFSIEGKTAVVTGGSRGIGEMITAGFLANGVKVYITARKAGPLIDKAKELSDQYGQECICLLYTSPSPRDKRQSRMPSSA